MSDLNIWLVVGVVLVVIELVAIQGIGLLFLGLGALSTAIILSMIEVDIWYQVSIMGFASLFWFLLLIRPLKKFVYGSASRAKREDHFDIVGSRVYVADDPIVPGYYGYVLWSGTKMNAKLADGQNKIAEVNSVLYVKAVHGNILICVHEHT